MGVETLVGWGEVRPRAKIDEAKGEFPEVLLTLKCSVVNNMDEPIWLTHYGFSVKDSTLFADANVNCPMERYEIPAKKKHAMTIRDVRLRAKTSDRVALSAFVDNPEKGAAKENVMVWIQFKYKSGLAKGSPCSLLPWAGSL